VAFFIVYIQEAHPVDLWQLSTNVEENVLVQSPSTLSERAGLATACARNLGLRVPAIVDGLDNAVERDYTGWPDRMYLIDEEGKVVFKSGPGPFGFKPQQLEDAIRGLLGRNRDTASNRFRLLKSEPAGPSIETED
jgi:hypothetical protein